MLNPLSSLRGALQRKKIYLVSIILAVGMVGAAGGTEGLKGEYYRRTIIAEEWQELLLTRIDPMVNFDWSTTKPVSGNFEVRWTGTIEAPNSETYTFHTNADGGVRLWVNNELIIDTWSDWVKWQANWDAFTGCRYDCSGEIALTAGEQYEIILEYGYERNERCELSWSTPTLTREIIPSRYLSVERPNTRNPEPADGAILRDKWASLGWAPGDFAASHDLYLGENFDDVGILKDDTFQGNLGSTSFTIGFPGNPYPDGLVPGTTYYWRIVEVNDLHTKSPWVGPVWSFSVAPVTAYSPNPADAAESVDTNKDLTWEPGFGGILRYVYFGESFDEVKSAAGALPQGHVIYDPGPLKMGKTYYWRVDEFNGAATHTGDVWSFTTLGAVKSLEPANGAVDVRQTPVLTWSAGLYGASHEVYFGTDKEAMKVADAGSPEYKGSGDIGSESFDPGQLEWDTTYYWRIDEVNNSNADSPWTGPVWSFTTANFLVIDDFEAYNDLNPDELGSNRIFLAWIDGFDNPTINGSVVGHALAPFAEQAVVHSGNQSMPFAYDNAVGKSEATLTLTSNHDWTVKGVNRLTIWYQGDSANAAEPMYVVLNGSAVVTNDNANAAQATTWTAWDIDLGRFTEQGVNLANVTSITLGFGNRSNPAAGGSGMMFFDDIRLYPPEPETP